MFPVFLIGGGWESESFAHTYGSFIRSASVDGHCKIALILAAEEKDNQVEIATRYCQVFEACGVSVENIVLLWGSAALPVQFEALIASEPTGVFVGGGCTPLYQTLLCANTSWVDYLREKHIPYAGFSAGAAIAARQAIVGGWQIHREQRAIGILDADFGESLTTLEVRAGLGLVPFAVDVHASQWGTLTRLMQVVEMELTEDGWTVDENTLLSFEDGRIEIRGLGYAYHVHRQAADTLTVKLYRAGAVLQIGTLL